MDIANPELDNISRQLTSLERPQKPKMLVVDDEPDNLDLLYRTFRRDFQVLRAESGIAALEMLATGGEVAVIISDQRMPEMKGTEFLSKTVPQFPDTMRIILTGFTDVEDLVEAINSGQVYKYITKPWDPNELKMVVKRAAETYELCRQRSEELRRAQAQTTLLNTIVQLTQRSSSLESWLHPLAIAFGKTFGAEGCILQLVERNTLDVTQGIYSANSEIQNWLEQDPLTQSAIASQKIQVAVNVSSNPTLANVKHYGESGIQSHLVIPMNFQNAVLAVLSLQWQDSYTLNQDELNLLHLCTQQVAIAIACAQQMRST